MNKKCIIIVFCAIFISQTKSEGCFEDILKCFSEFADSFFQNITETEHVNVEKIPEGYKQVKDVEIKTIQELTDSIQNELLKQSKSPFSNDAVVVTDNPKTQIFVKTYFSNFFEDNFNPDLERINVEYNEEEEEEVSVTTDDAKELLNIESSSSAPKKKNTTINKKQITSTTEDSLTMSSKTTVDYKNADDNNIRVTIDGHSSLTTQMPDNKKDITKLEQKPTEGSQVTPKHITQKVQKTESQNSIPQKISNTNNGNNESSNNNSEQKEKTNRSSKQNTVPKPLRKNQFEKDIRENIIQTDDEIDYDVEDSTDYPQIDYIDLYKDTTNEENEYVPTESPKSVTIDIKDEIIENVEEYSLDIDIELENDTYVNICHGNTSDVSNIYPWIATIFIKNDTVNSQFQYTCDGALLGDKLIITAARCVIADNNTVDPSDMVVFLGKKSLQNIGEDERHVRISEIKVHSNFTDEGGIVHNDLALLVMEEPVAFSDSIRPACLGEDIAVENSATTAWNLTGTLIPIFFKKNAVCKEKSNEDGTICATYGDEVPLCPSNGGLYASRRGPRWFLTGIRSGPPEFLCFTKEVHYTPLVDQLAWMLDNME